MYSVKEAYLTLQGEGYHAGRAAVFCRFSGCNLWSGREAHRANADCRFCDTDFVGIDGPGGGKFPDQECLAEHLKGIWGVEERNRYVVFTGGEPLLQLDEPLLRAVRSRGFSIAVETNGTISPPSGITWLTVSPKGTNPIHARCGQELKLVFPQSEAPPERFEDLSFSHFFLQPMHGPHLSEHTEAAVKYCLAHPKWRLSVQMHKLVGIA